jgi:hypothetical protein
VNIVAKAFLKAAAAFVAFIAFVDYDTEQIRKKYRSGE